MSCNRCPGSELKGSGYCKVPDLEAAKEQEAYLKALLAARQAQDATLMSAWTAVTQTSVPGVTHPVDPNPPAPRSVAGPGSSSTTITRSHGVKSATASWQSR
jgi:hypothetical protein